MSARRRLITALLMLPCALSAHEGGGPEPAEEPVSATADHAIDAVAKPHRLADGRLYVPKAVQRALGLRTEILSGLPGSMMLDLTGEVIADPDSAGSITAEQAGRLEAGPKGWPLPGAHIKAGETLAYLRPMRTLAEQAKLRAALAQLDNDLQISEINVERLKLQAQANGTIENAGNVYYEQARLDWEALKEKYRLQSEALSARVAVQARINGVMMSVRVRSGDAVIESQPLFELVDASRLQIAVQTFDPQLSTRLRAAKLRAGEPDADTVDLTLRGQEPRPAAQGWRLLFGTLTPSRQTILMPGQMVTVELQLAQADLRKTLADACVAGVGGSASGWVHIAPEQFEQRPLSACAIGKSVATENVAFSPGERWVTRGGALLSEYR